MAEKKKKLIYDIKPMSREAAAKEEKKQAPPQKKVQKKETQPRAPVSSETEQAHHSRWPIWVIAIGAVVLLFFTLSIFFSGATVAIEPVHETVVMEEVSFAAKKNAADGELSFELVVFSDSAAVPVEANGTEMVSEHATGTVTLYNNHNSESQRLLIETRLETPEGLIYKTDEPVVIPGRTQEGGEIVPGSVSVGVTADEPGEEYNIDHTDFSIVGFKGSPKYETFYARSTSEITGGFSGERYVISDEDRDAAVSALSDQLERDLYRRVSAEVPESYISFPALTIYDHSEDTALAADSETPEVTRSATIYAFLFDRTELAQAIAKEMISQYDGTASVSFSDLEELEVSLQYRDLIDPETVDTIRFTATGEGEVVWDVDVIDIADTLSGTHAKSFNAILSDFDTVQTAQMNIRPFWKRSFPDDPNDITIEVRKF